LTDEEKQLIEEYIEQNTGRCLVCNEITENADLFCYDHFSDQFFEIDEDGEIDYSTPDYNAINKYRKRYGKNVVVSLNEEVECNVWIWDNEELTEAQMQDRALEKIQEALKSHLE
jgi:hypothetical protein